MSVYLWDSLHPIVIGYCLIVGCSGMSILENLHLRSSNIVIIHIYKEVVEVGNTLSSLLIVSS